MSAAIVKKSGKSILGTDERETLLDAIDTLSQITSPQDFIDWTEHAFGKLIPHRIMICGVARVTDTTIHIYNFLQRNFPLAYIEQLRLPSGAMSMTPIMERWWRTREPQIYEAEHDDIGSGSLWRGLIDRYILRNKLAHGVCDVDNCITSYFSFSRIDGRLGERHLYLMKVLVPHMHEVLTRVIAKDAKISVADFVPGHGISRRELEVLTCICKGMNNREIGEALALSEKTVKTYVERIFRKLHVKNRAEAVAKALNGNLVAHG